MSPGRSDSRFRSGTAFPDTPGAGRARLLWGLVIGLIVGFVSATLRWDTRSWRDVVLRMVVSGVVFGLLGWRLGDRFWRSSGWWLAAAALVWLVIAFLE